MKPNEAPEKIYVIIDPIWGSMSVNYNRNDNNNIEYIREDAFIEKACKWLTDFYSAERHSYLMEKDIEEFKKYMKGE